MNTLHNGYTITTKEDSHSALIYKGEVLVKCIAGDIAKDGSHNAIEKAKAFIDAITKVFFWTDKTGRGDSGTVFLTNIGFDADEVNYDGITLHEWATEAEQGEEWENATDKYTCTQS